MTDAWWSIVFYGANFAPYFTRGMWAMIAVSIAMGIWTALLVWKHVHTEKRRQIEAVNTTAAGKAHDHDVDFNEKA